MQVLYNAQLFVFIWSKKVTPVLFKVRCRAKRKPVVWEHILGRVNARGLMYKKRSNDGTKRSRFQFTASKTNNFCTSVTAYEIASSRRIALYSSFDSCWCPQKNFILHRSISTPHPPWYTSLSCRRFPTIQTSFGSLWKGVTWNKRTIVLSLMGKFRSVQ